jgi:D-alanine-D-alanine ligase-like ATP-grasp enzyme
MTLAVPKPKACPDCGDGGIFHRFTYFSIVLDEMMWMFFRPSEKPSFIKKAATAFENAVGPSILTFFVSIGWAKKQTEPDDETQLLALMLWNEAKVRGIEMWEWRLFGLARNIFVAKFSDEKGGRKGKKIAFEGIPVPPKGPEHVWWMDDKAKLKSKFLKRGLAVAKGGSARNEKEALAIYRKLTPPAIVKPAHGSGSRHTILHITNEDELKRAFHVAKQVSPAVIIEEELFGPVYRATVVDGKFVAAIRRDPPSVVGDGVHTVAELVEEENKKEGRQGPYFSRIQLFENESDGERILTEKAKEELAWQKMSPESVPPEAARVYFHQKVNWSVGGTTCDVTDEIHPDNRALFERAARELTAPIVGIDFIIRNISTSWQDEKRCGILECNSMPFFDNHHLPFEGKPRNVAAAIWDMVTP